ncbi:MAG: PIG-L family deacetylase [Akkermansiaceae bacterium]|nr:PIG-L family deacetylase [Akkermansiaceae bacterium]
MKLHHSTAELFIPDGALEMEALRRITHLGIGAHQDDLEFMAFHGIIECIDQSEKWFGGVTCTNGAGSARCGPYSEFSDAEMMAVRRNEQNAAAIVGKFGAMLQLDYPSSVIKSSTDQSLKNDIVTILSTTQPDVVYTHNPADKHETHIGVALAVIEAIRELPIAIRPKKVIGCEVWRNLDWLADEDKVLMDVSGHDDLAAALNAVFDSQISGGKRYDLAILGRRAANATFYDSHSTDSATQVIFGIDLTPLILDDSTDVVAYIGKFIQRFNTDVSNKLNKRLGLI